METTPSRAPKEEQFSALQFSLGGMLVVVAAICVVLAITVANWTEYRDAAYGENPFDLIYVCRRYSLAWLVTVIVSLGVVIKSTKRKMQMGAFGLAGYALIACLINICLPLGFL